MLAIQVFNGIVEVRHGRIHRGLVVGRYVAFLADHEVEEVRELASVLFLEFNSRLFKQTKNLVGIDVIHALGFIDLHSRQNRQLADLMVQRHQGIERLARHQAIPEQTVEELREIDNLTDMVLGNGAVELSQSFGRILICSLSHRIDLAYGYTELLVAKLHALNDPTVVGDQHGVGVVIATVEALLEITAYGVHANDIVRQLEIFIDLGTILVPCQEHISHRDMGIARADQLCSVIEPYGVDLAVTQQKRLISLVVLVDGRL